MGSHYLQSSKIVFSTKNLLNTGLKLALEIVKGEISARFYSHKCKKHGAVNKK